MSKGNNRQGGFAEGRGDDPRKDETADAYDFTFNLAPDDFLHIASFEQTGVKAWVFDSAGPNHIVFTEEGSA